MSTVAIAGSTFTFSVKLYQAADTKLHQVAPALAVGDFTRTINGAGSANLGNPPTVTPAGEKFVQIILSAAETTAAGAGGYIDVAWHDQTVGPQWCDGGALVFVHAAEIDAACTVGAINNNVITAASIATDAIDDDALATSAVTEIVAGVWGALLVTYDVVGTFGRGINDLLRRLGAFTGTGLNTVLGFLRAIMRSTAGLTPSDVGGTYDNTTDSLEAIRDALATLNLTATMGSTAPKNQNFEMYSGDTKDVTVTVTDSTGAAVPLAGYTIVWALAQYHGGPALVSKSTTAATITILGNTFSFSLNPVDTDALKGNYYHEAEVTDLTGDVTTVTAGHVTILEDLT